MSIMTYTYILGFILVIYGVERDLRILWIILKVVSLEV